MDLLTRPPTESFALHAAYCHSLAYNKTRESSSFLFFFFFSDRQLHQNDSVCADRQDDTGGDEHRGHRNRKVFCRTPVTESVRKTLRAECAETLHINSPAFI